ncbi:DUF1801 domain-containing protein [Microterricola viridarii]|uniref:YdhG-like domain-containing protein n=1 Tax=Microterricola viridarii TaxID=412690 RepID=A0A1H1XJN8_9MICO|nr:DUF1801 domain-containing protein [Microterricola viridarii]SDT09353.1 hypothetical protein SAMN04489834_2809 [Microterricola viridarii]
MRNRDFDVFAEARLTPAYREVFESLRRLVEETVPSAHEVVSTGSPAWQGTRILASVSPSAQYLILVFERGAAFTDEHGLLEGTGYNTRHVKLWPEEPVPLDALRDYFTQAAAIDAPAARA